MIDYSSVKLIHQTAAALSVSGFLARGIAALAGAAWVRGRAARSVPHFVDTVLLASAMTLAWTARLDPTETPWLMAKITALVVYIGLGMVALRPAVPSRLRALALLLALCTFAYIVAVAIGKQPGVFSG